MTAARRLGKVVFGRFAVMLCRGALAAVCLGGPAALATTVEDIVTNPQTGLAIDGFDPVSYFIDGAPEPGRPDQELRFHGVVWRFRNPGNMAAFRQFPDTYEPRFGGYDPVAIGRGAPTPGNPTIWLVVEQRLYLFFDTDSRDEFRSDPTRFVAMAEAKWPTVRKLFSH